VSGVKVQGFGGTAPKVFARMLPTEMAQVAINTRLDTGRLEGWKNILSASISPVANYFISANTKTLFKKTIGSADFWFGSNEEVDYVLSPIAEDPWNRLYYTGSGTYPKMTASAIWQSGNAYRLGIPAPAAFTTVPALNPTTSANVATEEPKSVSYIYTYVSQYGEEGPPISALTANILDKRTDQSVDITFPTVVAPNSVISHKRLYRTDASGTYRRVDEVAGATYNDTKADSSLGEAINSTTHIAPPDDNATDHVSGPMLGLTSLPNGILAGFSGKTICFSEAFLPHAFPTANKLTVRSDIVGLAPMTNGVLVLTKEKPAMISGLDPRSMSMSEIDSSHSCVSKNSIVDMGMFVLYASPDGLVSATEQGLELITESLFTRDQWQALVPSTIKAFQYEGQYVAFYTDGSESKGFILDPRGGKNAYVKLDFHATAGFNDLEEDTLYLVVGGSLVKFASSSTSLMYAWRSKKFYSEKPVNMGAAKVDREGSGSVTFKLFADGALKHTQTVANSDMFRLPSGYKSTEFEFEVVSAVPINSICLYETAGEIVSG